MDRVCGLVLDLRIGVYFLEREEVDLGQSSFVFDLT